MQQETTKTLPCPKCGDTETYTGSGKGVHYASLRCAACDRWIKWLKKPGSEHGQGGAS